MQAVFSAALQNSMTLYEFLTVIDDIGRKDVLMECQVFISKCENYSKQESGVYTQSTCTCMWYP